ncbi:MAG: DNA gyrase inhibitor YacG [Gammaproteobacteria bacterium]
MPCPVCKLNTSSISDKQWLPFCSKRCQLIDLGDWLDENHRIPEKDNEAQDWENMNDDDMAH